MKTEGTAKQQLTVHLDKRNPNLLLIFFTPDNPPVDNSSRAYQASLFSINLIKLELQLYPPLCHLLKLEAGQPISWQTFKQQFLSSFPNKGNSPEADQPAEINKFLEQEQPLRIPGQDQRRWFQFCYLKESEVEDCITGHCPGYQPSQRTGRTIKPSNYFYRNCT